MPFEKLVASLKQATTPAPDHLVGDQLLPCCGFNMWPDETSDDVLILGCPSGVDWWVEHQQNSVRLTAPGGGTVTLPFEAYRTQVLGFADQVEAFYQRSAPKEVPSDADDACGDERFWAEWHRRRNQWPR